MKRIIGFAIVIILLAIYVFYYLSLSSVPVSGVYKSVNPRQQYMKQKEADLLDFIERCFIGVNGEIITNTNNSEGHGDTLSESVGLFMDYCVRRGKKELFDREYNFLKDKMLVSGKYVKWKAADTEVDCNSLIDDLRIVRALLDAYDRWGDADYFNTAGFIQEGIYTNQTSDYRIYEFYEWKSGGVKKSIPLCYLDLYTFDRLGVFGGNWVILEDRALYVVKNGRISDSCPFFCKYYNYDAGKYIKDEELGKSGGICLTYTLYTVLHMSEINENTEFFTEWLKKELETGRLYAWYNPDTMKPAQEMESTAVYALAAVYAKGIGENELYSKLVDRMLDFMVVNKESPYYGGFGNETSGEFYSFDNLLALYALSLVI